MSVLVGSPESGDDDDDDNDDNESTLTWHKS